MAGLDGAPAETGIREIREKLARGELPSALQDLRVLLARVPDDADALYLLAVTHRYTGDSEQALAALQRLKQIAPTHSRAYQEEGHVHRDAGRTPQALRAYTRAVSLNPALEASLRERAKLLSAEGASEEAHTAAEQLQALQRLPKALRAAMDLAAQNKLLKAEQLCRAFLKENPEHVEGMRLLADIGVRLGVLDDAEFLLESALVFQPDHLPAQMEYVQVLRKRQKFQAALTHARALLATHPRNLQIKSMCAVEYMQTGDYATALQLLDEVLEHAPNDARTLVTKGHALKTSGRADDAIGLYRRAAEQHPAHGEAWYALANLKTYRFNANEVRAMQALEDNADWGAMDRVYLNFALAKAFEDGGDYENAFGRYAQGNALKKAQSRYDADRMHNELAATRRVCTAEFFAGRSDYGAQIADPIFIVGLPRAGSTLLEQILSSHSQVDGTLELPDVPSLSQRLRRRAGSNGYPNVLRELSADECLAFGEKYLEDTHVHRGEAPRFVDKMPNNFRHIGLIRLMLPDAKIIDARREPMACCFSGFKQLFAEGQEFSYSLEDLGRYYRDYVDLMTHWNAVLPGYVLRVNHEDVVADLEHEVRRVLAFCNLPFEEACLKYYETERNIRTPSSEQVRQPIFRDGVEQWRHFEPWLAPLRTALDQEA